jgi:hypothetical protein
MKLSDLGLAAGLLAASALPAFAHHSFAMFDGQKTVAITGTVKELDLVNPHSWLQVMVADTDGQLNGWSIEMGGPAQVTRMGLDEKTIQAGDKVTVNIHPLRDGSNGGQFVSVVLPNGQTIGGQGRGGFGGRFQRPPPTGG